MQSPLLVELRRCRDIQIGQLNLFAPGAGAPEVRFRIKRPVDNGVVTNLFLMAVAENQHCWRQFARLLVGRFFPNVHGTRRVFLRVIRASALAVNFFRQRHANKVVTLPFDNQRLGRARYLCLSLLLRALDYNDLRRGSCCGGFI